MPASAKIIELQQLIQRHSSAPPARGGAHLPTGLPHLDELLDGGLPKGGILELTSEAVTSGSTSLLLAILRHAAQQGRWSALIDGHDSFDPQSAGADVLACLLWIRCRKAAEAIRSADLLLRDGNLPLIFLDLRGNPAAELRKIPDPTWYRLQRVLEPTAAAFLVLTPRAIIPCAQVRLVAQSHFGLEALDREPGDLLREVKLHVARKRTRTTVHAPLLAEAV